MNETLKISKRRAMENVLVDPVDGTYSPATVHGVVWSGENTTIMKQ